MKAEKLTKINLFVNILPLVLLLLYIIGVFSSLVLFIYCAILLLILLPFFIIFSSICLLICKKNYCLNVLTISGFSSSNFSKFYTKKCN